MKRFLISAVLLCVFLGAASGPAFSGNPFTSKRTVEEKTPGPIVKSRFFVEIVVWQHQLKQKMSDLVRDARTGGGVVPLFLLLATAFGYGAIHAAGPGHGKFVAMSYFVSRKSSVYKGLLFGICVAAVHGASGVVGVLGIRHLIQKSFGQTLDTVTSATQIASFGLIVALGLAILVKSAFALVALYRRKNDEGSSDHEQENSSGKGFLAWAGALGLTPCPAVVMAMLFCISMDAMVLGLLLASCISLGMAATISCVSIAVIVGKNRIMKVASNRHAENIEAAAGLLSGLAITIFAGLFLLTAVNAAL